MVELRPLAAVVDLINGAAAGVVERWLIVGATARDLILQYSYGLPVRRLTADLDIAVAVGSWKQYEELRTRLIDRGATVSELAHRLALNDWQIDLVPFGAIERNGAIVWPGADTEMTVLGFEEASVHALEMRLPKGVTALVAPVPALLILKLIAWDERHREVRRDGADIGFLIASYAEEWNRDRLYDEASDLLEAFAFDNELAGAALLGRDAAAIARPLTAERVLSILAREAEGETFLLAADMDGRAEQNLKLLRAALRGWRYRLSERP